MDILFLYIIPFCLASFVPGFWVYHVIRHERPPKKSVLKTIITGHLLFYGAWQITLFLWSAEKGMGNLFVDPFVVAIISIIWLVTTELKCKTLKSKLVLFAILLAIELLTLYLIPAIGDWP